MRSLLCMAGALLLSLCVSDAGLAKTAPHTARPLPVSAQCHAAEVPAGTWYAVRKMTFDRPMSGLRRYYYRTLRRKGNIFGTDYCAFERRLVYANPVGANGRPVNDDMTNLSATLLIPVDTGHADRWICFQPKGEKCEGNPATSASNASNGAKVSSGNTAQRNIPAEAQVSKTDKVQKEVTEPPADYLTSDTLEKALADQKKALSAEMEGRLAALSDKIEELRQEQVTSTKPFAERSAEAPRQASDIVTKTGLDKALTDQTASLASAIGKGNAELAIALGRLQRSNQDQLEKIGQLEKKVEELSTRNAEKGSAMNADIPSDANSVRTPWKDIIIAILATMLAALGLFVIFFGKPKTAPRRPSAKLRARAADTGYEPGEMIPIKVPKGLALEGKTVEREVYMKTKGRNDPFDYWIMPQHAEAALRGLSPDETLERVLEKPREYLVLAKNLPSHWKKCPQCQLALEEKTGIEHVHA